MNSYSIKNIILAAALVAASSLTASAQSGICITEFSPWSSGNSPYAADWFELTNTSASAINITGWKFDDNSNSFASGAALSGVTSIGAGQSVIFFETTTLAATVASFNTTWFGTTTSSLVFGSYTGSGLGLSTGGDAINIYNNTGTLIANVTFGANLGNRTFDSSTLVGNGAVSTLSTAGVRGAFLSANNGETGSPGAIPEPSTYALLIGLGVFGIICVRRRSAAA